MIPFLALLLLLSPFSLGYFNRRNNRHNTGLQSDLDGDFQFLVSPPPDHKGALQNINRHKHTKRTSCPAGKYWENGCQQCPAGYYCPGGTTTRQDCPAGKYSNAGASSCTKCPAGTYTSQTRTQGHCTDVQPGWKANAPTGATGQTQCGGGYYSPGGTTYCTICPAGTHCNSQTNPSPVPCQPGRYSPNPGSSQDCPNCPKGQFNNIYGATSCCDCCSGWYNDQTGQTHCFNCPGLGNAKQGSPPKSTSVNQCTFDLNDYTTCDQTTSTCPPTRNPHPSPGGHRRARRSQPCPGAGQRKCPVTTGTMAALAEGFLHLEALVGVSDEEGPYECIDVLKNPESCGGCVSPGRSLGPDGGRDCTAIVGAARVGCERGSCVVHKCKGGYALSLDGTHCEKLVTHDVL